MSRPSAIVSAPTRHSRSSFRRRSFRRPSATGYRFGYETGYKVVGPVVDSPISHIRGDGVEETDKVYFARRAAEEEAAAARAADPAVASVHRRLAEKFAALAVAAKPAPGDEQG